MSLHICSYCKSSDVWEGGYYYSCNDPDCPGYYEAEEYNFSDQKYTFEDDNDEDY